MININEKINKIVSIESILSESVKEKYSKEIDLNDPNWQEIAEKQSKLFHEEHEDRIQALSLELVDYFVLSNQRDRRRILIELSKTEHLKNLIQFNRFEEGTAAWFRDEVVLFILRMTGSDTRDSLLQLNDLDSKLKESNSEINLKNVFTQLSDLVNLDRNDFDSNDEILDKVIESLVGE